MKKQILDLDLRVGRGFSFLSDNPEERWNTVKEAVKADEKNKRRP